ncbi:MAG: Wzz/FepE/Etk N-terminal domain-containing protein [Bacteroides sp.]|nr:Wzz/FepE/Etk N-terminal domain-containing protein [Bacteroides sp.]MCM1390576.1 Wzz/FepE/Etk N-terminal domain-containing protein [Bacteroides sp.]
MQDERDFNSNEEQEIDLLELAQKLWSNRKTILKWAGIGAVIGLVVAFSIPKEYTTTIKLAPEYSNTKGSGGLGALASLAGISSGGEAGTDAVSPNLYPDVVQSVPFAVDLFDTKVTEADGKLTTTVYDYLAEHTSSPWWSHIMALPGKAIGGIVSLFKSEEELDSSAVTDPFRLTKEESLIVNAINARIGADVDTKTFVISISATMQDPLVSAVLADTVAENLKKYVTAYRTNKARQDLEYAEKLNNEAKKEYYAAQQRYAEYVDKNHGIALNSRKTEEKRLENEAALAYNLYNTTAQRLQTAKAKVQETTPVYAVVQPATVPIKASKPSKPLILIGFVFLAAVAASAWILFGKDLVANFKKK